MKKKSVVTARYLQSIKTFLTLELSQYRKSGSTFYYFFPGMQLRHVPTMEVLFKELCWLNFCPPSDLLAAGFQCSDDLICKLSQSGSTATAEPLLDIIRYQWYVYMLINGRLVD